MKNNKKHFLVAGIAALFMGGSMGLNLKTMGVFLQPIANDLNVATGAISQHTTVISLGMAFAVFAIPPVLERFAFRRVLLIATIFVVGSTMGMAFATEIWIFNTLGLIRGLSSAFFGVVALQLLINNWFIAKHGIITSFVFSFSGLAGAIFAPILSGIIENQGWQFAYIIQACIFLVLNLPGLFIPFKYYPEDEGLEPYTEDRNSSNETKNTKSTAARKPYVFGSTSSISLIFLSILTASLIGLVQHLPGIGMEAGIPASAGAFMISASMLGNVAFKFVIGGISDFKGVIVALVSMIGTVTIGLSMLLLGNTGRALIIGSFLLGAIYSVVSVGFSVLIRHLYSDKEFQRVFPMVNFTNNIGGALAVSIFGYSYDLTGGYGFALTASLISTFIIIGLIFVANQSSLAKE